MKQHDIWKSKRFVSSVAAAFVSLVVIILAAYTKVAVEPETQEFVIKGLVYLVGLLVGSYAVEDTVVAARSGVRASKYENPE
jgi:hypothetical protein